MGPTCLPRLKLPRASLASGSSALTTRKPEPAGRASRPQRLAAREPNSPTGPGPGRAGPHLRTRPAIVWAGAVGCPSPCRWVVQQPPQLQVRLPGRSRAVAARTGPLRRHRLLNSEFGRPGYGRAPCPAQPPVRVTPPIISVPIPSRWLAREAGVRSPHPPCVGCGGGHRTARRLAEVLGLTVQQSRGRAERSPRTRESSFCQSACFAHGANDCCARNHLLSDEDIICLHAHFDLPHRQDSTLRAETGIACSSDQL